MSPNEPAERARDRLLEEHRALLVAVLDAADAVAAEWDHDAAGRRDAVAEPLERELDRRGLLERLPTVLVDAIDAAGFDLRAAPVPAPPYVVVTSAGPILRATVSDGRFVIAIRAFEVERNPVVYRRRSGGIADALDVTFVDG